MNKPQAPSDRGVFCVIPARAGSKGIPGKNIVDFEGKPLLAWTIQAALGANTVCDVIVSTESDEIAKIAKKWGADVPFARPPSLAQDHVHAVHTVLHALDWHEETKGFLPLGVMMLLPTSPLRTRQHVEDAVQLFLTHDAPAVIGVTDTGKHLTNLRYMKTERLEPVLLDISLNKQRQGAAPIYGVSGAMFLARSDILRSQGTFHLPGALGYPMNALSAIDVNSPEDLALARWIKKAGWSDKAIESVD